MRTQSDDTKWWHKLMPKMIKESDDKSWWHKLKSQYDDTKY